MVLPTNQKNAKHSAKFATNVRARIISHLCLKPRALLRNFGKESDSDDSIDELFLGEIGSTSQDANELFINLNVGNQDIRFKVDTGAQCNVMPEGWVLNEDRRPKTEDRRPKTEDRRPKT